MTPASAQNFMLNWIPPAHRWMTAAVLTPALMLGSFGIADDHPANPFQNSGGAIIRVAAQAEAPAVVAPPPLVAPPDPNQTLVDSAKPNPRKLRPISEINPSFDYDPTAKYPCEHLCPRDPALCPSDTQDECPLEEDREFLTSADRAFPDLNYMWCASNLYHNPLYFEDVQAERYGQVKCNDFVQPFYSVGKFGVQLIGLPYQMALDNPHDRRYALGYYRPGDCAPRLHYRVPLNARAAAASVPTYAGAVFLLQ
ncbi:hypothetical protein Pan44_29360 [Caulifigura coniformis]|uniref:Uncharacterized protein n=1 Tax=Caulifigura coniformis TaxID=2527983 RepID=A0A517SFK7_9PLAN|nr:hypothetical protein [Caulifigura coniformis]QDT54897.1 hypothetical protein Pan44_29360 [Caulifigura coniformis]